MTENQLINSILCKWWVIWVSLVYSILIFTKVTSSQDMMCYPQLCCQHYLKLDVPIAFSSPRALPEVVLFRCQMKAHIFLIITPKFKLQIYYTLEVIAENVPISSISILIFSFIFITALSPVSHTYFCPRRENKKHPWGKIVQND